MSAIEKLIGEPETSEMGRLPDNHVTRDKPHSRALPGLTKKGTRPRFKLVGPEADLFVVLREIDITLRAASLEPDRWLRTPARSNPLAGKTPIA
jgi:hypothetical protein